MGKMIGYDENEKWDGMRWGVVTYSEIYPIQIYYH